MIDKVNAELARLGADDITAQLDSQFDSVGTLVRVERDEAVWHLMPAEFLELLEQMPDGAGSDAVHQMIEKNAQFIWHGPSPPGTRDSGEAHPED